MGEVDAQVDDRWVYARKSPQCQYISPIPVGMVISSDGESFPLPHTNRTMELIAINVLGGVTGGCSQILSEAQTSNMVLWKA